MRTRFLLVVVACAAACSRNTAEPTAQTETKSAAASPAASAAPALPPPGHGPGSPGASHGPGPLPPGHPPGQLPPGHPPMNTPPHAGVGPGHGPQMAGAGMPAPNAPLGAEEAGGLAFHGGEPLVRRPPGSSMRAAEYVVEGAPEAPLTVFFFPGQGGAIDANVDRWVGQLQQPDGSPSKDKAEVSRAEVAGITVTRVEVRGSFGGGMVMPGQQPHTIDDAMLLGAIAEGPNGPLFFKWVGPAPLLTANEPAFDALIASLKPAE